jgi:hypothetical protein
MLGKFCAINEAKVINYAFQNNQILPSKNPSGPSMVA